VSPSWRDRVEAFVGAQSVHLVRVRRGLRPRPEPALAFETVGGPDWPAAIDALGRGLAGYGLPGADVRVVLSNHFVRYALVPGIEALSADDERIALARHQLVAIYGERAAGWRVALAEHGARTAGFAAAVASELMEGLSATVTAAGHTLRSVEPYLVAAFNACRRELDAAGAWLVVAEPDRLCVAYLVGGAWIEVRNARAMRGPGADLPPLLEQMRLTLGANPGPVYIASREPLEVDLDADWQPRAIALDGAPTLEEKAA
jgi:hypothetical protein